MRRRTGTAAGLLLAALAAVALSGCSVLKPTAGETPTAVKSTAMPTPTAMPTATPTPEATPTGDADACASRSSISILGYSEGDEEPTYWATWNGREFVDNGPTEFARGTVTTSPEGRITYTVAEGDAPLAIGDRLCIHVYEYMNFLHLSGARGLHPGDVFTIPEGMKPFHGELFTPRP